MSSNDQFSKTYSKSELDQIEAIENVCYIEKSDTTFTHTDLKEIGDIEKRYSEQNLTDTFSIEGVMPSTEILHSTPVNETYGLFQTSIELDLSSKENLGIYFEYF